MWKTIVRRVLIMIPQLFVLSFLIFILAKFMPGDPFTGLITPETDPNVLKNYVVKQDFMIHGTYNIVNWIANAAQGDFGDSYTFKVSC